MQTMARRVVIGFRQRQLLVPVSHVPLEGRWVVEFASWGKKSAIRALSTAPGAIHFSSNEDVVVHMISFSFVVTSPGHASTRTVLPSGSTSVHQAVNKCNDLEWQRGIWKFARDTGGFTSKALRFFRRCEFPLEKSIKIHKRKMIFFEKKCFEGVSWNTWDKNMLFFNG